MICRKYFFQNLKQFSQGNNVLGAHASNTDGFLFRDTSVSSTLLKRQYLEQTEPMSTMKHISCRKYSFQKLTPFSQGNNVQDGSVSNTHGFLWRDTCVSASQLNRPFWNKEILSPP
jgi:hypothetical protein